MIEAVNLEDVAKRTLTCPKCGREFEIAWREVVDVDETPDALPSLIDGSAFVQRCPHCQHEEMFQLPMTVFHLGKRYVMRLVYSEDEVLACEAQKFRFIEEDWSVKIRQRVVCGYSRFQEKLRIFNAGLDDGAIECAKHAFLSEMGLSEAQCDELRFIRYTADELAFLFSRAGNKASTTLAVKCTEVEYQAYEVVASCHFPPKDYAHAMTYGRVDGDDDDSWRSDDDQEEGVVKRDLDYARFVSYVQPRCHAVLQLLPAVEDEYRTLMRGARTPNGGFDKSSNAAVLACKAIYNVLQRLSLTRAKRPENFGFTGHRIRLANAVLETKTGTSLDLSVLFASFLEACGLCPVLLLREGFAFVGCLTDGSRYLPEAILEKLGAVRDLIAEEKLVVWDPTMVASRFGFEKAVIVGREVRLYTPPNEYLDANDDYEKFVAAIDVGRARVNGIQPLEDEIGDETVARENDGYIESLSDGWLRAFVRRGNALDCHIRFVTQDGAVYENDGNPLQYPLLCGIEPLYRVSGDCFRRYRVADRRVIAVCARLFWDHMQFVKQHKSAQREEPIFGSEWQEVSVPETVAAAETMCGLLFIPTRKRGDAEPSAEEKSAQLEKIYKRHGFWYGGSRKDGCYDDFAEHWGGDIRREQEEEGLVLETIDGELFNLREFNPVERESLPLLASPIDSPRNAQLVGGNTYVDGEWWFVDENGEPFSHQMGSKVRYDQEPTTDYAAECGNDMDRRHNWIMNDEQKVIRLRNQYNLFTFVYEGNEPRRLPYPFGRREGCGSRPPKNDLSLFRYLSGIRESRQSAIMEYESHFDSVLACVTPLYPKYTKDNKTVRHLLDCYAAMKDLLSAYRAATSESVRQRLSMRFDAEADDAAASRKAFEDAFEFSNGIYQRLELRERWAAHCRAMHTHEDPIKYCYGKEDLAYRGDLSPLRKEVYEKDDGISRESYYEEINREKWGDE